MTVLLLANRSSLGWTRSISGQGQAYTQEEEEATLVVVVAAASVGEVSQASIWRIVGKEMQQERHGRGEEIELEEAGLVGIAWTTNRWGRRWVVVWTSRCVVASVEGVMMMRSWLWLLGRLDDPRQRDRSNDQH